MADRIRTALLDLAATGSAPVPTALARWCDGLARDEPSLIGTAATELARLGRVTDSARAQHDAAVSFARCGQIDAARRSANTAFQVYERLEAEQWRQQLIAALRAHGLRMRPRRGSTRADSGWSSLTPTEQRVVGLVAEGLTNTEIGERLFVSRRTIESHLGHVYTKLGFSNRVKLVAEAGNRSS